uniref:Putative carboxypeptidase d n=1 Tax=Corethrella appendiculata TaxID=1370023 RepID=W4VRN2_9DIPT
MGINKHNLICLLLILIVNLFATTKTTVNAFTLKNSETILDNENFLDHPHYETHEELQDLFAKLAKEYPKLAKVFSIGTSLDGRELIVLEIRKNIDRPRSILTPMFKYVANMHGDETVGRKLLIYLAQYLLSNYGKNQEITNLIDKTDIFLMPTMNPDGYARSKEGSCESPANYFGRYNAAGVDLNRDFPDRFDDMLPKHIKSNRRQPETISVMNWILKNPFVLSANLHGGAVVASYPFDNSKYHHECCEESKTPDDKFFKYASLTYAENHPIMKNGHDCNETFQNGITNGAFWYELNGGMQDFNYVFANCFEITLELSCCKYPKSTSLPAEWHKNKKSLIEYIKLVHSGVKGLVTDQNGYPIRDAEIFVDGIEEKPVRSTERGEYWRLLVPGNYKIKVEAIGYYPSQEVPITITDQTLNLNFSLKSYEFDEDKYKHPRVIRDNIDKYGFILPTIFKHHNFTELESFVKDLSENYPNITRLYSIGKSVQGRDLWVLEITKYPGAHKPGKPEVKYIANMHGNEVVGRELMLLFAKYLCENYNLNERVTRLINTTRLHILFSMNPDGYEVSDINDHENLRGRTNANNVDLNRNFPDQYGTNKFNLKQQPETLAVMNWSLSIPFVLSANFHNGALVANYPFDDSPKDFASDVDRRTVDNPTEENDIFLYLAKTYSNSHSTMHLSKPCPSFIQEQFPEGITNGAAWYSVTGGMQDWSYLKGGAYELTIEIGCTKYPSPEDLPNYWMSNREALLKYIEQAQHGVTGVVKSSIGKPIQKAIITINNLQHPTFTTSLGDYYRILLPGLYNITVEATGYEPETLQIQIPADGIKPVLLDFSMMRDDPQHWSSAYDYRILDNVIKTKYHSDSDIDTAMAEFENKKYKVVSFEAGDNDVSMVYHSIKITSEVGSPEETKFHILILSSLFQSSPIGREMSMNLARHILEGFTLNEPRILKLLKNAVIHIVPITDDFQSIYQQYQQNNSICDPYLREELPDRLLNPETDHRKDMFIKLLQMEKYDLALTFSAGGNEVYYPHTNDKLSIYSQFASSINGRKYSHVFAEKCETKTERQHQIEATTRLTNQFLNLYEIPLFTLQMDCCKMPIESKLSTIWRNNLERMLNFLQLIDTGVKGYVRDNTGKPLRNAILRVRGNSLIYKVTKNMAHFHIALPHGPMEIEFSCVNFTARVIPILLDANMIKDMGEIVLQISSTNTGPIQSIGTSIGSISRTNSDSNSEIKMFPQSGIVNELGAISGFVLDESNHPIPNAKVYIKSENVSTFTNEIGKFELKDLHKADLLVQVDAPRHSSDKQKIHIDRLGQIKGVLFHLQYDESVMGMPRLVFVILAGCTCVGIIACATLIFSFIQSKRQKSRYYSFSLLPQKGEKRLFDDDDEGEETELFRAPIKKLQPYYDDLREPITDTDDDDNSEEDVIMLNSRVDLQHN